MLHRNVKRSVYDWIVNLFENPSAEDQAEGIPVYTVYGETELLDPNHKPGANAIYLTDSHTLVNKANKLPALVLESDVASSTFIELGSRRRSHYFTINLSIYARNRAERDDLASFVESNLDTIHLYDYHTSPATLLETAVVEPGIGVADVKTSGSATIQGTLANWVLISWSFPTLR